MITGNLQNPDHADALMRVVQARPNSIYAVIFEPTLDECGFEFDEDTHVLRLGPVAYTTFRLAANVRCRNTNN